MGTAVACEQWSPANRTRPENNREEAAAYHAATDADPLLDALAEDGELSNDPAALDDLPVDNLPLLSLKHGDLTVEGWSRAAVQTYWRVPELKILFDIGGSPWAFMGTPTVAITHAHLDHLAALPQYVARRRMMKMDPPTILLPAAAHDATERMLRSWHKLDRGRMACELIGLEPGEEYRLGRDRLLTCFATQHTVPSIGYIVWEVRKKLRADLRHLSQDEVRQRAVAGETVSEEVRLPLVCYCGDTAAGGLDADPAIYQARLLITEMSFFRPEHSKHKIKKFGHTHLDDLIERADRFENERILLGHLSTRTSLDQARRALDRRLPAALKDRVHLWA